MISETPTILKSILELFEAIKDHKLKSIATILFLLSIILVKPIVYYYTLYVDFLEISTAVIVALIVFLIGYIIYNKKNKDNYHEETVNYLLTILIMLLIFIIINRVLYDYFWLKIYETEKLDKSSFINSLHKIDYSNGFYDYVLSHFSIVLLYTIEFVQIISTAYLIIYIIYELLFTEEPLKSGFISVNWQTIILTFIISLVSFPWLYSTYLCFWNKIF